jgi:Xaa-Pro aminopeptidase
MKSREPVLVHGRDEWDGINLPPAEFRARIAAIRDAMADEDVDALFVYGRGDRDGDLCYVSNLVNKVPNWGLLVTITPDTVLVRNERSSRTRPVVERATWIDRIEFCDSVVEEVGDDIGPDATTVATAGFDRLPYRQRRRFESVVGDRDIVELDHRLAALRVEKSARERDQIARAGRILDDVHELVTRAPDPVAETDIATDADRRARLRGAQDVRVLVGNSAATEPHLRPAENHIVRPDDPLVVYTAVRYEGYWAERTQTVRLDGETPYDDALETARDVYADYLGTIRTGATVGEVLAALESRVGSTALELAEEYDPLHGIGLAADEAPTPTGEDAELADGATLSLRLAVRSEADADGLIVLNDTVVVTDDGAERLTGLDS